MRPLPAIPSSARSAVATDVSTTDMFDVMPCITPTLGDSSQFAAKVSAVKAATGAEIQDTAQHDSASSEPY